MSTRDALLAVLRESEGVWISGDDLAKKFALTRSAVWKHVSRLRKEGCEILSSPGKGYLLTQAPDRLVPDEIRSALKTRVLGKGQIVCLEWAESTNATAKSMALRGAPEGTLVLAEVQSAGRGRKGRKWFSPVRSGLYLSLVLRPRLLLGQAGRIPILASLALAESLVELGISNVTIKWPNDVLIHRKKVAGILTEVGAEIDSVDYMIIGLGINLNTARFPRPLQDAATSLLLESGERFMRSEVLARYLVNFEERYAICGRGITGTALARWKDLAGITGKRVPVEDPPGNPLGLLQDLDEDGALIVNAPDGRRLRISSGDVRLNVSDGI